MAYLELSTTTSTTLEVTAHPALAPCILFCTDGVRLVRASQNVSCHACEVGLWRCVLNGERVQSEETPSFCPKEHPRSFAMLAGPLSILMTPAHRLQLLAVGTDLTSIAHIMVAGRTGASELAWTTSNSVKEPSKYRHRTARWQDELKGT